MAWGDLPGQLSPGKTETGRGRKKGLACVCMGSRGGQQQSVEVGLCDTLLERRATENSCRNSMRISRLGQTRKALNAKVKCSFSPL